MGRSDYETEARGVARAMRRALSRVGNVWWDTWLGIETGGVVPIEHPDSVHYATMSYSTIWSILDHLALRPSDVFVDVGSGKGRVLCCAARYAVGQVIGLDLSEPLCAAARENARRVRGRRAPIRVHHGLANEFDYSSATVLFLFNPFGAATLAPLVERMRDNASQNLRIAYANPIHDAVFERQDWLERTARWAGVTSGVEHAVSFYRSR
jgi:SAM-dependent methyltransferase